jgi:hypothetical protein
MTESEHIALRASTFASSASGPSESVDQAQPLDASEVPGVPSGERQVESEARSSNQTVIHADLEPKLAESNVDLARDDRGRVIQGNVRAANSRPILSARLVKSVPNRSSNAVTALKRATSRSSHSFTL